MEPGELLDGVAWGEVCRRVTIGVGVLGCVLTDLGECSVFPVGAGAPSTAECICVLEEMSFEGE